MPKAFVLLNTEVSSEEEVIAALNKFDEVVSTHVVYGVYDIIAEVEAETFELLKDGVLESIRTLENIRSTVTMIVAKELYL